jgi:hypothetical protein
VRRTRKPGVVLALTLALAGCGHKTTEREQVARYVRQISAIEARLARPVSAVTQAGGQFAAAGKTGAAALTNAQRRAQQQTLARSRALIEVQERRLRALPAPPAARPLRGLLVRFTSGEASLTRQLALMVAFLPRFNTELAPLGPAITRLSAVLSKRQAYGAAAVAAVFAAKARALRDFAATTSHVVTRLRVLSPPAVLKPQYDAQVASLRGMGTSAVRLAGALAGGAPTNVAPLLLAFDRAAAATHSATARRAQTAAVRAYNARVTGLATLAQAISRERLRLAVHLR